MAGTVQEGITLLLQYMMFIRLCKKNIVHVSDQLMQVWSVCWVETRDH